MIYEVFLTDDALRDLEEIDDYICTSDSPQKADYVLQKIESIFQTLVDSPKRGSYPEELLEHGIRDYRQVCFKPYRIIYRVQAKRVYIYMVADGRRDMQSILGRRLLGPCKCKIGVRVKCQSKLTQITEFADKDFGQVPLYIVTQLPETDRFRLYEIASGAKTSKILPRRDSCARDSAWK